MNQIKLHPREPLQCKNGITNSTTASSPKNYDRSLPTAASLLLPALCPPDCCPPSALWWRIIDDLQEDN